MSLFGMAALPKIRQCRQLSFSSPISAHFHFREKRTLSHRKQFFQSLTTYLATRSIKPYNCRHSCQRAMTTASGKTEWLVILPDRPGKLQDRMNVRAQHIEKLKEGQNEGFWQMGGAFLEEAPKDGEDLKIHGSIVIAQAHSADEVLERLKKDIYSEQDVWDFEKVSSFLLSRYIHTCVHFAPHVNHSITESDCTFECR
ncbi:YCII-related domain protein [Golovinomyces cichoracearum]|uniref:YCII-related domain protein n=1 Tax=Golovinomyces cichoracearum TaxID=62708 RepID=A0A420IFQ6_9PEZI|nr:YCII-related domain protein [Golovinomyces cichoracearum]